MEEKENWNLKEIFEDDSKLEWAIGELYSYIDDVKKYRGKLSESVDEVYNCYKALEKALEWHERIYVYAMMKYHQDMANQESIKLYKRVEKITAEFSEAESFISPEMSKIDDAKLESYLEDPRMKEYEKIIKDIIKSKKHILTEEVEEVLAKYSEVFGSAENIYDIFTNTELEFKDVIDSEGNHLKMNAALFSNYLMSKDENIRKQAFDSMYEVYKKHINTITEIYLTRVKQSTISSKLRNYESSLDAATDNDDSNVNVYKTLVKQIYGYKSKIVKQRKTKYV